MIEDGASFAIRMVMPKSFSPEFDGVGFWCIGKS